MTLTPAWPWGIEIFKGSEEKVDFEHLRLYAWEQLLNLVFGLAFESFPGRYYLVETLSICGSAEIVESSTADLV
ncbi:hypothetical protein HZ326_24414 [Fusarium oxysporum f. sp. albedinis]|nr:hypothetical protein HZ326_24414 [Fusarium oxysporum f. sp. albedinis]